MLVGSSDQVRGQKSISMNEVDGNSDALSRLSKMLKRFSGELAPAKSVLLKSGSAEKPAKLSPMLWPRKNRHHLTGKLLIGKPPRWDLSHVKLKGNKTRNTRNG